MIYKTLSLNWTGVSDCMLIMQKKIKINVELEVKRIVLFPFILLVPLGLKYCSIHGFIPRPKMFVPNVKTLQT